jgi:hypothetical protein
MERIRLESNFELLSHEINKFSKQLQTLKLQRGNDWILQKINNYKTLVATNLDTSLITQEESDALLHEINNIAERLSRTN